MTIKSADKKQALLAELGEMETEGLQKTLDLLDNYSITPPSPADTDYLLHQLTPILEQSAPTDFVVAQNDTPSFAADRLQLAISQTRLFSWRFVAVSIVFFLLGIKLTTALNGDTLRFLANASPLLGILTILYQFRANYNHMSELEAACPYTPAQLTLAKLIAVLCYDILLGLAATPFASYGNYVLWQVVAHWLAPLLLTLGIALLGSLGFGISGGCLLSAAAWAFNLAVSKDGKSILSYLLPQISIVYIDLLSGALGLTILAFSFSRLNTLAAWMNENQHT